MRTVVGILGTIHNERLREQYHCSLDLYREVIHRFKPDLICGEVHPDSWQKYLNNKHEQGYWGEPASEYWELIFPYCEEHGVEFVPIDWFELDVWNDFDPFLPFPEEKRLELEKQDDEWFQMQMDTWSYGNIPFNSAEFDQVTKQKYEWMYEVNPAAVNFRWIVRNQIMIQRAKNAIKANPQRKILCVVGADHNYLFHEGLKSEQILLQYPL